MSSWASKKSLLVLVFGKTAPSTRFRWLDFASRFDAAGWRVSYQSLAELRDVSSLADYDVVVLQKTMVSQSVFRAIRRYARRLIYDVDDRIWYRFGRPYGMGTRWKLRRRMRVIAAGSDLCVAANHWIAEDLEAFGGRVEVVPMAINSELWSYRAPRESMPVIGWTGSPKNLIFLDSLRAVLSEILAGGGAKFMIHCGRDPGWSDVDYGYLPYEEGKEMNAVQQFDIGICPFPDDPFTCGKSPIKALQYLASGATVVASPFGAVKEMLMGERNVLWAEGESDWRLQLRRLLKDPALRLKLAENGRRTVETEYSCDVVFTLLNSLLAGRGEWE